MKIKVQDLPFRKCIIIKIGSTKNPDGNDRDDLPNSLLGKVFYAERTGSHTVQPIIPFGSWFYNIVDEQIEEMWIPWEDEKAFDAKEIEINPVNRNNETTYYSLGKKHRVNGYATLTKDGGKLWYQDGKLHRDDDLPAVIWANGNRSWYNKGTPYTESQMEVVREKRPELFI